MKLKWKPIFRDFEKQNLGISGQLYRVLEVEYGQENELGYTSSKKTIHLNPNHHLLNGLNDVEKVAFMMGVDAHELLHQIFTNFSYFERKMNKIKPAERPIFAVINNVLEDAAIENFADQVMGGRMLTSLNYSIAYIYSQSPELSEAKTPFSQYIAALINFGDMGPLKGDFTFPETRKAFIQTAPLFERGVYETNGQKRIDIAYEIMQATKSLWEKDAEENEEMMKLMEELEKRFKSPMKGSGSGKDADETDGEGSKKSARRKITIKKVSKEELEEMKKNGEIQEGTGSGKLPDGDITVVVCEDDDSEKSDKNSSSTINTGSNSDSKGNEKNTKSSSSSEDADVEMEEDNKNSSKKSDNKSNDTSNTSEDGDDNKSDGHNDKSDDTSSDNKSSDDTSKKGEETSSDNGNKNNPFTTSLGQPDMKIGDKEMPADFEESDEANAVGEISEEEYELSEEDKARIEEGIKKAEEDFEKETTAEIDTSPVDEFSISSPKLGKKSCLNYRITYSGSDKADLEETYSHVLAKLNGGIKTMTTQLKRIFANDYEDTVCRTSGRINLKRAHSGRVTARIFDRRLEASNKSNFCVELLVDESGSMASGNKATSARECCIALSEVFGNLNIPVYVMGFTADTRGHDIVHNHYITWKNTHSERLKLLNITARANNCDGYSIRYATEVLKKSKAENKLLIVLSDGQPAASGYYDGVADTKQAIRDARKHTNVLGVAIGNSDTETIFHMYEKDFLHVSKIDDLFFGLSKKLQKMMKNWGE